MVADMMKRKGAQGAQNNVCLPFSASVAAPRLGQQLYVCGGFVYQSSDVVVADKVS